MITAVQDEVELSLSEVKSWLRLTDTLVGRVATAASEDDLVLELTTVEFLNKGQYLTINQNSYLIESVDYNADEVTFTEGLVEDIPSNAPVYTHPHDRMLVNMIASAKSYADEYLNNPFSNGVPPEVKQWLLKMIALDYDRPEAGVSRIMLEESISKTYAADIYEAIDHLRLYPL